MRLALVAIGTSMPGWLREGWDEYARRMPPQLGMELVEVASPKRTSDPSAGEASALLARVPAGATTVALDGGGRQWSTRDLATRLERWMMDGAPVAFLVGGADGHGAEVLSSCRERWSLGRLTYPHMLVRVIVAEQLYRAWTVISAHPYHRE